jgi:hypothetical protein
MKDEIYFVFNPSFVCRTFLNDKQNGRIVPSLTDLRPERSGAGWKPEPNWFKSALYPTIFERKAKTSLIEAVIVSHARQLFLARSRGVRNQQQQFVIHRIENLLIFPCPEHPSIDRMHPYGVLPANFLKNAENPADRGTSDIARYRICRRSQHLDTE